MNILIVHRAPIPVFAYGGTERVIWDLGRCLAGLGHRVRYLVPAGSHCDFAEIVALPDGADWRAHVPAGTDVVHLQFQPGEGVVDMPCLATEHGNPARGTVLDRNTVFVSADHAARHGSDVFVHNGLDWSAYGPADLDGPRGDGFHFLGKAAWRVKNVQGAIDVARDAGVRLDVLGGHRLNLKRGLRFTWSPRIRFHGMVGGAEKLRRLQASRGLVFPVLWHEPFGLAVTESLYFGCPVFATPYGALRELVPPDVGVLSDSRSALAEAVRGAARFDRRACHAWAARFSAEAMARGYLRMYERVCDGETLHAEPPRMREEPRRLPWRT